jgi:hypothetical protein
MNALWFVEMCSSSLGANRLAISLEASFPKLWIMVIGRNSFGDDAPCFLGSSMTNALLSLWKQRLSLKKNALSAAMISCLITDQVDL